MSYQPNLFGWGPDFDPQPPNSRRSPRLLAALRALGERRAAKLEGKPFGLWLVLKRASKAGKKGVYWLCLCRGCDREFLVSSSSLLSRGTLGCKRCRASDGARTRGTLGPYESQYKKLVRTAKRDGKLCTLTLADYQQIAETEPPCHYCRAPLLWERQRRGPAVQAHNLDRKDNDRGYEAGNVVPCCDRCNRAKGNRFTYREWWAMTAYLRLRGQLVVEPADTQPRQELLEQAIKLIAQAGGLEIQISWSEAGEVHRMSQRLQ